MPVWLSPRELRVGMIFSSLVFICIFLPLVVRACSRFRRTIGCFVDSRVGG